VPVARQQNVAQRVSSKKQLSTKTADRHAHAKVHFKKLFVHGAVITMHEKFLKMYLACRGGHIWEKQICLKIQQRQRNAKWFQSLLLPLTGSFNSKKF